MNRSAAREEVHLHADSKVNADIKLNFREGQPDRCQIKAALLG
jgi:hypothetical protein